MLTQVLWWLPCQVTGVIGSSKRLPALLTIESSVYWTLAWRSSGENVSLFWALPLYSFFDAPSPLTDVRSPCQFSCRPFAEPSRLTPAGVLSLQPYPVTCLLNSLLTSFCFGISFLWTSVSVRTGLPGSVYCFWMRWQVSSAISLSVWQHF